MEDCRINRRKLRLKLLWISLKKTHQVYAKQYYLMESQIHDIRVRHERAKKTSQYAFASNYEIRLEIFSSIHHLIDEKLMKLEEALSDLVPALSRFGLYR